jgi:tricorn protease
MTLKTWLKSALILSLSLPFTSHAETLLLQQPAISKDHIAFVYAGDIYTANKQGEDVLRLTSHAATEEAPHFSPDGKIIAFTANYEGNSDVYTIPVTGGQPTRLTWHPDQDTVVGWNPKTNNITFMSAREMASGRSGHLYQISADGGFPKKVMEALAFEGDFSKNGKKLAYRPYRTAHIGTSGWRNHRGGATPPIWIMDLDKNVYEEVPHVNASDTNPLWIGKDLYFLSDRDKTRNLYKFSKSKLTQITNNKKWDIMSADVYGTDIIYSMGGELHVLNSKNGRSKKLSISINPDLPQLRPQWKNAMSAFTRGELSATGKRALISARGDIYTVPLEDGSTRNITKTPGVNERDALWSPEGDQVVYISDKGGVQNLVVADQFGKVEKTLSLGEHKADFSLFQWSPDGKRILYSDSALAIMTLDLADGEITTIDRNINMLGFDATMSFDGDWIAYTKSGENYLWDIYLYQVSTQKRAKLTNGLSHSAMPAFSRDGKYLYFASSTNAGPTSFLLDLSTQERPQRFGLYAAVLQADGKSPLLPRTDEEKNSEKEKKANKEEDNKDEKESMVIDLEGLSQRIVALPAAERLYRNLLVANDNNLYFIESSQPGISVETNGRQLNSTSLRRFNLKKRSVENVLNRVQDFGLSPDGKSILLGYSGRRLRVADIGRTLDPESLSTSDVRALIDPKQEWAQIFDETWRNERDYFYDPNMHGLDWDKIYRQYRPLLDHVGRREDLNWLLVQMISEMQVGHNRVGDGDLHSESRIRVGLLGADIRLTNGNYVIEKIYTGESWNPFIKAPLSAPGIGIAEGDIITAVNGQTLNKNTNFFSAFVNTVGKQVNLTIRKEGSDATNDIVVEPISSENSLRNWHWVESNRRKVEELSDGKIGYVYLPNTTSDGFTYFNRMFFAQTDKQAMIVDDRRNGGGKAANYVTDILSRKYLAGWKYRSGSQILSTPAGGVYGPKVMLIDQDAGSGGDFLPYSFKRMGIGKLIGKTTWGGLIGISANRRLMDGGRHTVPYFRFFTPDHEWRLENEGVAPDIEVELDPTQVNDGKDTQLEAAVNDVLEQLKSYTPIKHETPPAFPTKVGG